MSLRIANTARAAASLSPSLRLARGMLRILGMAAMLTCGTARAWEDFEARPATEQAGIHWDLLTGYWSDDRGSKIVLTTRQGILEADRWKGEISFLAGPWRTIARIGPDFYRERIAVATSERWCSAFGKDSSDDQEFPVYRIVAVGQGADGQWMEADLATQIHPPADAMTAEAGPMWQELKNYEGIFKGEGPWHRIPEEKVPQWFRDLEALDLVNHPRCQP